jgi:hypothetical protein
MPPAAGPCCLRRVSIQCTLLQRGFLAGACGTATCPGSNLALPSPHATSAQVPSRLLLAAHYLLATSANLAAAAAVGCLYLAAPSLPAAAKAVAATATAWMVATPWLQAQPTAGGLMGG